MTSRTARALLAIALLLGLVAVAPQAGADAGDLEAARRRANEAAADLAAGRDAPRRAGGGDRQSLEAKAAEARATLDRLRASVREVAVRRFINNDAVAACATPTPTSTRRPGPTRCRSTPPRGARTPSTTTWRPPRTSTWPPRPWRPRRPTRRTPSASWPSDGPPSSRSSNASRPSSASARKPSGSAGRLRLRPPPGRPAPAVRPPRRCAVGAQRPGGQRPGRRHRLPGAGAGRLQRHLGRSPLGWAGPQGRRHDVAEGHARRWPR